MSPEPTSPSAALAHRFESLLQRAIDRRRHVRHGLLAVAAVDGTWMWQGAHGVLDTEGTPATPAARYPIASVTKLYTATVVLRLVERAEIRLDDVIVDLLPRATTDGLHRMGGVDRTGEITIEHLLGHTSGLADYYEEDAGDGSGPQTRLLAGEDAPVPFEEVIRMVREDLEPYFPPQPLDAPRAKAHYSDTNYQLLGAVIETVTGRPIHRVFDEELFAPLDLTATSSYPHPPSSGASPEPAARVWSKHAVLRPEGALTFQKADGGLISTLGDQVTFMQALVSGGVFDDPGTWDRMQARWNRVFFPVEYGLGVMRYAPSRLMSPLFAIPPLIGHTGSTATWLFHCPELGIVTAGTFDVAQPPLPFRFLPQVLRAVATHHE